MDQLIRNDGRRTDCPLCGGSRIRRRGVLQYGTPVRFSSVVITLALPPELWRCDACGSGFTQNVLREEDARALYTSGDSGDRWSSTAFPVQKTPEVVAFVRQLATTAGSVLDVGCNTGELLDFVATQGSRTAGVEYSDHARAVLERKGHGAYWQLDQVPERSFDLITAFDLIEHLYDVPGFLERCRSKLAPGGRLLVLTGDIGSASARLAGARWWYAGYPEHVVFPSRSYLTGLPGFRAVRWLSTYASTGYRLPLLRRLRGTVGGLVRGRYRGLPAVGADHYLALLEAV